MIIFVWFCVVCCILLTGFTLVGLTFRHWYLEARRVEREKIQSGVSEA